MRNYIIPVLILGFFSMSACKKEDSDAGSIQLLKQAVLKNGNDSVTIEYFYDKNNKLIKTVQSNPFANTTEIYTTVFSRDSTGKITKISGGPSFYPISYQNELFYEPNSSKIKYAMVYSSERKVDSIVPVYTNNRITEQTIYHITIKEQTKWIFSYDTKGNIVKQEFNVNNKPPYIEEITYTNHKNPAYIPDEAWLTAAHQGIAEFLIPVSCNPNLPAKLDDNDPRFSQVSYQYSLGRRGMPVSAKIEKVGYNGTVKFTYY